MSRLWWARFITATLALALTLGVCWRFKLSPFGGGDEGIHGDGFLIYLLAYAAVRLPIGFLIDRKRDT